MTLDELCKGLLDKLEQFDKDVLPLGLYASDELVEGKKGKPQYQEWQGAVLPYLSSQGCSKPELFMRQRHIYGYSFDVPGIGNVGLQILRFSNIKVRKYGSGYYVDKHENRASRWEEVDLSGHISDLWKHPDWFTYALQARVLLFMGFDKSQRPLERELVDLEQTLRWEKKGVEYLTRTWQDKANRGFGVRLSAWACSVEGL